MKKNLQTNGETVLARASRTIKNKLPITWIGKLKLAQDALVIFNCTAWNQQGNGRSLPTMVSIKVDEEHASHNAIPELKIDDRENRPKCSVNFSIFLEKGEHRFEMKGRTFGNSVEPSRGELNYDYCALALAEQKVKKPVQRKKISKKVANKKTVKKKAAKKKTSKKKSGSKSTRK